MRCLKLVIWLVIALVGLILAMLMALGWGLELKIALGWGLGVMMAPRVEAAARW